MTSIYRGQIGIDRIVNVLKHTKGNISAASRILKVASRTLNDWILNTVELEQARYRILKKSEKVKEVKLPLELSKPDTLLDHKYVKNNTYVITCCQNNTDLHKPFIKSLQNFCSINNAQLIVIPIRYKNVTAYVEEQDYRPYWPVELSQYYLNDEIHLNKNLVILGDLKIQATASSPLSGIECLTKEKSAIVGHPQISLRMIATPVNELPKQLMTTGSCSIKNYSKSKAGYRASFNHTIGAVVVELDDNDMFYTRQINASEDGSFYDLDKFYSGDEYTEGNRAEALVCGDIHFSFIDDGVMRATWLATFNSIYDIFKPKKQFFHDVLDFHSASHHHKDNVFLRYAKHNSLRNSVRREIDQIVKFHDEVLTGQDTTYHYISSNHNDALLKWLKESDPKNDLENIILYHELQLFMLKNTKFNNKSVTEPNPLEHYIKSKLSNPDKVFFHTRNERVDVNGVDVGQHGDIGPNGIRGSALVFSKNGYKSVIGHSHTPCIEKGCYQVGTSSVLQMGYNQGYSSWCHTHCIIYPNGKRTLINIIKGEWRPRHKRRFL